MSSRFMRVVVTTAEVALPLIVKWLAKHCERYIVFRGATLPAAGGAGVASGAASGAVVRFVASIVLDAPKTPGTVRKGLHSAVVTAAPLSVSIELRSDDAALCAEACSMTVLCDVVAKHRWLADEVDAEALLYYEDLPLDRLLTTMIKLNKHRDDEARSFVGPWAISRPLRLDAVIMAKKHRGGTAYLLQGMEQYGYSHMTLHARQPRTLFSWRLMFNGFVSALHFDGLPPECEMELSLNGVPVGVSENHSLDVTRAMRTCTPAQYDAWSVDEAVQNYIATAFAVDATYLMNMSKIDIIEASIVTRITRADGTHAVEHGMRREHVPPEYADADGMPLYVYAATTLPTANITKGYKLYDTVLDHVCRESRDTKIIVRPTLPSDTRLLSFVL